MRSCLQPTCLALLALGALAARAAPAGEELRFGAFGRLALLEPTGPPTQVALFLSGDGGWNKRSERFARRLAEQGALVVGLDVRPYLKALARSRDACVYPAADLESLSKFVQKTRALPAYLPPVLVGYSSGATLVYAALAQAPPGTFRGAISLGFCIDLELDRPLCPGHGLSSTRRKGGGFDLEPSATLAPAWWALQGADDRTCTVDRLQAFVASMPKAQVIVLPGVGHGFHSEERWLEALQRAWRSLATPPPAPVRVQTGAEGAPRDLPLVELPAERAAPEVADVLAVIYSGDGGWAGIDRELGARLAARGVAVVGVNCLQYFWTPRTPDGAAGDLAWLLRHYLRAWGKRRVLLLGYSLGADVLPFLVRRLPAELRPSIALVGLLGPGQDVTFEFHVGDWLGKARDDALDVPAEIEALRGLPVVCLYGADEEGSACPGLPSAVARAVRLPGGHHLGGDYARLADLLLGAAGLGGAVPAP
jgi:type IV secretory pathway VirJ component